MKRIKETIPSVLILTLLLNLVTGNGAPLYFGTEDKPILIITTDIGGDPDDQQSLIRLLVFSNEFDIQGLIASSSGTRGELDFDITRKDLIRKYVSAYRLVYNNLTLHDPEYPNPDTLFSRISSGNPHRGRDHIGMGHDTEGSDRIIEVVDRAGDRPVHVAVWGGQTDLVQALWEVKHTRSNSDFASFLSKLRVYDINDQDGLYGYIMKEFPDLFYILAKAPDGMDKREGSYRGMYLGGDETLTSRDWIDTHIRLHHGALGELYPPETWTAPNPHGALKEGDTPSWFYFLNNGLQNAEEPGWGGWGGRFKPATSRFYRDAKDFADTVIDARSTVSRWRVAFQNAFQARMDWCVMPYEKANHNPVAVVMGDDSKEILYVDAGEGDTLRFSAIDSYDMDGGKLEFTWWTYPEAGSNLQCPSLDNYTSPEVSFIVPYGEAGADLHLICEVSDNGTPSLTAYRRVVIRIY